MIKHVWKDGIKVFKNSAFNKIPNFSLPLTYVIYVCTMNMFR